MARSPQPPFSATPKRLIELGRVMGRRGNHGALTVRIHPEDAELLGGVTQVVLRRGVDAHPFDVESTRTYKDRWILKLKGLDDTAAAQEFRGAVVVCEALQLPEVGPDEILIDRLLGLDVFEGSEKLGVVTAIVPTGGVDLIEVRPESPDGATAGDEILIPLAREFLLAINDEEGRLEVRIPEGLRDLNRTEP